MSETSSPFLRCPLEILQSISLSLSIKEVVELCAVRDEGRCISRASNLSLTDILALGKARLVPHYVDYGTTERSGSS